MFPNFICIFFYFTLVHGLYILMVLVIIYFICTSNKPGKFQVKYMNVYIEPLIDELLKLSNAITMYDISRPIWQSKFQFHAMVVWTIQINPFLWFVFLSSRTLIAFNYMK